MTTDKGESFEFLGFLFRKTTTHQGKPGVWKQPKKKATQNLRDKIKIESINADKTSTAIHLAWFLLFGKMGYSHLVARTEE